MHSSSDHLVEDIRQDTETGVYYKYGYFQTADGRFVQIGVLAEKIYGLLGKFELQHLIEEYKAEMNL
ncbi:MAG: hypothetical protein U5N58_02420 [Actinomycetota bacterium]|nr:hypothetical protein [Actinomycetota bacterium]